MSLFWFLQGLTDLQDRIDFVSEYLFQKGLLKKKIRHLKVSLRRISFSERRVKCLIEDEIRL